MPVARAQLHRANLGRPSALIVGVRTVRATALGRVSKRQIARAGAVGRKVTSAARAHRVRPSHGAMFQRAKLLKKSPSEP